MDDDPGALRVTRSVVIPMHEIALRATTSGGPGGQHANRSLTRVTARFDVRRSGALGPRQRERVIERIGPVVEASASDSRSQTRNRELALRRLAMKLAAALRVDAPRRVTRPTKGSVERRLDSKQRQSRRKRDRRPPSDD